MTALQCSSLESSIGLGPPRPALFTRISIPFLSLPTPLNRSATSSGQVTSQVNDSPEPPADRTSSTVSSRASRRRPQTTTRAPSLPSVSAIARPIPEPPPVTTATFPSKLIVGTIQIPRSTFHVPHGRGPEVPPPLGNSRFQIPDSELFTLLTALPHGSSPAFTPKGEIDAPRAADLLGKWEAPWRGDRGV